MDHGDDLYGDALHAGRRLGFFLTRLSPILVWKKIVSMIARGSRAPSSVMITHGVDFSFEG